MRLRECVAVAALCGPASVNAPAAIPGPSCPADIDGDGIVGIQDFLGLLAAWGTAPGGPPDLDGDGIVGIQDMLTLLSAWGPCPTDRKLQFYFQYTWTFNQSDPLDFAACDGVWLKKGYNYEVWRDAVAARIIARGGNPAAQIIEDATRIRFVGEAVLDFCSMGHVVMTGAHVPPVEQLDEIRRRSHHAMEVGLELVGFETINQGSNWRAILHELRNVARAHVLDGDPASGCGSEGLNGYGCPAIDKEESRDRTGGECDPDRNWTPGIVACPHTPPHAGLPANAPVFTKHTWDIDVTAAGDETYASEYAGLVAGWLESHGYIVGSAPNREFRIDGILFDNVLSRPYKGTASNGYPAWYTDAAYQGNEAGGAGSTGWKGFFYQLKEQLTGFGTHGGDTTWHGMPGFVWGNAPESVDIYSQHDLRNRWIEHFFRTWVDGTFVRKTLDQINADIALLVGQDIRFSIGGSDGPGNVTAWFTSPGPGGVYGTWADILAQVEAVDGFDHCFVAIRTTSTDYLYWQPEFESPD